MRVLAVIPARHASSRLPGKPLLPLAGKPVVQHVYERVRSCARVDATVVATDDVRIRDAVWAFGGEVVMTAPDHPSGTDRVAEVARVLPAEIVVNVQGDEPLIPPAVIEAALEPFFASEAVRVTTLAAPFTDVADFLNPNCVKVVVDTRGDALYFSRLPIPYVRPESGTLTLAAYGERTLLHPPSPLPALRHGGLYAYRNADLQELVRVPPSPLERAERLEQLRILENGGKIRVVTVDRLTPGIDTPDDYRALQTLLETS
ncbi:MAG: 3-deoxy-manno-octulosonate cytidylyltransferase [Acidobacteria bacterium]|nr:3-deoxy-manno-octulosonate cytidylyltransferase [Acidobacteriota bacterium]